MVVDGDPACAGSPSAFCWGRFAVVTSGESGVASGEGGGGRSRPRPGDARSRIAAGMPDHALNGPRHPHLCSLVLYDSDCGFCTRSSQWLARITAARVEPLQAADLGALGVSPERAEREMPAVLASGAVVYGADAVAAALASGPWWARVGAFLLRVPGLHWGAGMVYGWVARNRHSLPGGTGACRLR
ncbi:thiol-disulfide oxidoreductase DCC family protein [Propioniciclava sp.]|uniref:thiol-disulfide oxidoreductase DCC family protein n=1 Tax=Propioniciclava sp. TaxID=2038686 RepID=UPI0039E70A55